MKKNMNDNYSFGKFVKERWIVVLILLLIPLVGIAVFVPLLLCDKFQISDLGSFLGGILAYIGTVLLGLISVWQNEKFKKMSDRKDELREKEIKESQRLEILPYLFTDCEPDNIKSVKEKKQAFIYIDDLDCQNDKQAYDFYNELPNYIERELQESPISAALATTKNFGKYIFVKYTIKNVGQAGAVNIRIKLNNKIILPPFSMVHNETKVIEFLFETQKLNLGSYPIDIVFNYSDIKGTGTYIQQDRFHLHKRINSVGDTHIVLGVEETNNISFPKLIS